VKDRSFTLLRPARSFAGLLCVLLAMWYAASSQNNAAAYLLLFALSSVIVVSIPHTIRNLSGLKVTAESAKPAFAGDEIFLPVEISNEARAPRHSVSVSVPGSRGDEERVDTIAPGKGARVMLRFPAQVRGEHEVGSLRLATVYPLGFMRARKKLGARQRYLVYPKPGGDPILPSGSAHAQQAKRGPERGEGDDFAGVRAYVPGESQRHIDWKAVARGQALMTKQYAAEPSGLLDLDFASLRLSDPENRLSQLTLWVIEAERARRPYGLRLPGAAIAPSLGDAHFHRCLRALALFK